MLRSAKHLYGWSIHATDGVIGKVYEFLFDDQNWHIRYLVVETGSWLFGRKVLLTPQLLGYPNNSTELFNVNITREQVKNSPDIDTDKPVYRQHEEMLYGYYGWDPYWPMSPVTFTPGGGVYPIPLEVQQQNEPSAAGAAVKKYDQHLRSTRLLAGCEVRATDDQAGYVSDCIIDDKAWVLRYFVVAAHRLFDGRKTLIAPDWLRRASWDEEIFYADLAAEDIKQSPEYDPDLAVSREFEDRLCDFHSRPKYWESFSH